MPPRKPQTPVQQTAIGDGNVQIVGDKNVVNQTVIQKFFNIFKSDTETTEQRNRRIMLNHVENFWVKGILEKSLHGAALLELGIKEDPDAVTYPWAIKREATKETLPTGMSMLEIFQEIGMGRSLLILGAPGSGKTTMLLELTRQLIERAREDVTEPIPVVFNLSSWTENLTLADWLARELNVIYTIPKKIAPTWVKENKMLLLLDGLDEVKQESRDKCVVAINQFRKDNGLTSITVCSRIQDYADLKARLSFDGAIEIQPLTSKQVNVYFRRLGKELVGIRQVLEKDAVLREMAETPLFLSIMTLAYNNTGASQILVSGRIAEQREYLFDAYITHMFKRKTHNNNVLGLPKQQVISVLSWLANITLNKTIAQFHVEVLHPSWLDKRKQYNVYKLLFVLFWGWYGLVAGAIINPKYAFVGFCSGFLYAFLVTDKNDLYINTRWSTEKLKRNFGSFLMLGLSVGLVSCVLLYLWSRLFLSGNMISLLFVLSAFIGLLLGGLDERQVELTSYPGQGIKRHLIISLSLSSLFGYSGFVSDGLRGLLLGILFGWVIATGRAIVQHYAVRAVLVKYVDLPWRIIPFLDYCVDLIFLRRVGGGYIFVHRLLMEHFADMYTADEK